MMTSADRLVAGECDVIERLHFSDGDGAEVQPTVLLHEFSPPSPAPHDSLQAVRGKNPRPHHERLSHNQQMHSDSKPLSKADGKSDNVIGNNSSFTAQHLPLTRPVGSLFYGQTQEHRCLESDASDELDNSGSMRVMSDSCGDYIDTTTYDNSSVQSSAMSSDMSSCQPDSDFIYACTNRIAEDRERDRVRRPAKHRQRSSLGGRSSSPTSTDSCYNYSSQVPARTVAAVEADGARCDPAPHPSNIHQSACAELDTEAYIYNRGAANGVLAGQRQDKTKPFSSRGFTAYRTNPLAAFDTRDTPIV
jgi:hypothetical protein